MSSGQTRRLRVGRAYTKRTAPLYVPLIFWATGATGMVAGLLDLDRVRRLLFSSAAATGPILGAVHLLTLAGLTMVMMGALYQLVPVLFNGSPVRVIRSVSQWALYTAGLVFFIWGLNGQSHGLVWIGSGATGAGILYFLVNMGGLYQRRSTWNITAWFFTAALFYLALTVVMGGLLLLSGRTGIGSFAHELSIHLVIALGGWFGLLVAGASYRLWAMFGRKHREPRYWQATWVLANLSIVVLVVGNLSMIPSLVDAGWIVELGACGAYLADMVPAGLIDRRTMQDGALRLLIPSMGFLWVWQILGSVALWDHQPTLWRPAILAYGLGWVGMNFMWFSQKIVPFIVWLHRYAHVHGRGKMPRLKDIWPSKWTLVPFWAGTVGISLVIAGAGLSQPMLFQGGMALVVLAWLMLFVAGIRAVAGPHHLSDL